VKEQFTAVESAENLGNQILFGELSAKKMILPIAIRSSLSLNSLNYKYYF